MTKTVTLGQVPEDVWRNLKIKATLRGQTIREYMLELLRKETSDVQEMLKETVLKD